MADPRHERAVPIAALRGRDGVKFRRLIHRIIQSREAELTAAVQAEKEAARAALTAARAAAQQRVARIKKEISQKIASVSRTRSARASRLPTIGSILTSDSAHATISPPPLFPGQRRCGRIQRRLEIHLAGGGALGYQISPHIYAELGYRALAADYENDGFVYDVITHGAQLTMGMAF